MFGPGLPIMNFQRCAELSWDCSFQNFVTLPGEGAERGSKINYSRYQQQDLQANDPIYIAGKWLLMSFMAQIFLG